MADLFRINTNISALRALTALQEINSQIIESQERISTGKKVSRASDDPSTFFVSRLFEASISELVANQIEIERGIDFLETSNTRMDQVASIIIEIIDLVNTANSGAVSSAEQQAISREISLLVENIDNILSSGVSTTIFGSPVGISIGSLNNVSVSGGVPSITSLNIQATQIIVTGAVSEFNTSLTNLSNALITVLEAEEQVGAWISRLEFELEDIAATEIATRGALSTIADADLAEEQVRLSSLQILQQTSLVGLIQANTAPAAILGLITA